MSEAKKKIRKDYFSQNQEAIHHYMWKSKQNIKDEE